jgi:hypothetical protein
MILEGVSIGLIVGGCALVAWKAKNKFQPEIEKEIENQKQKEIPLQAEIKKKYN